MTIGIDVSEWQSKVDWSKVKPNVDFALLRAGYGRVITQKDKAFDSHYANCKANKIPVGAYWFSYAKTPEEAVQEAKICLEVIKGKQFEYPIYFDIENNSQFALGREKCTAIARAFLEVVEKAGYWVGLYSSQSHLEKYFTPDILGRYAVWVAHYYVSKTSYKYQYGVWQKTDKGTVQGINGYVDLNECYVDYPTLIKSAGLNGFSASPVKEEPEKKTEPEVQPKEPEYIVHTAVKGDTLWKLAEKYLKNPRRYPEIMKLNGLTDETIYVGNQYKIPKY